MLTFAVMKAPAGIAFCMVAAEVKRFDNQIKSFMTRIPFDGWFRLGFDSCRPTPGELFVALNIEPEVDHVAILDDVLASFEAHLTGFLRALLSLACHEI